MSPSPDSVTAALEVVRQELARVLASKSFTGSERLSRFLRYTVEQVQADPGAVLKEYTIATLVYDKPASFDPRVDPIVRVEARRLRARLKQYYDGEGSNAPLRIDLPKGSYVPVFHPGAPRAGPVHTLSHRRPMLLLILALGTVGLAAGFVAWQRSGSIRPPPGRIMLVVLPFQNLTGDSDQEYLCDGMTEEMSMRLGGLDPRRMGVVARTSAMKYKHTSKSVDQIGRELGVDYALEGSVRRSGARLRVTAQLIQVRDQTHLWGQDYDREPRDLLAVESEIAGAIAREVQVKVSPDTKTFPVNAEAYEAYLRGRFFFNKGTPDGFRRGAEFFSAAIRRDPNYALAHDGLADTYAFAARFYGLPPLQAFQQARAEATKALEIAPDLAEGHSTLGEVLAEFWDWKGAERELRRSLELNPNYALTRQRYGGLLAYTGHVREAIVECKEAQRLDPLSTDMNTSLANVYTALPNYDEVIKQSHRTLELEKDYAPAFELIGEAYRKKGMLRESFEAYQRAQALEGVPPERLEATDRAFAANGMKGYWSKRLEFALEDAPREPFVHTLFIAWYYALLKNKEESFKWLEKAYREHDFNLAIIKLEIDFDFMRSDPRFQDLLGRIGLAN